LDPEARGHSNHFIVRADDCDRSNIARLIRGGVGERAMHVTGVGRLEEPSEIDLETKGAGSLDHGASIR
jgi:hypothetical protein